MSKVPGFRSGALWKKVVASSIYGLVGLGVISATAAPSPTPQKTIVPKSLVETTSVKTQESILCEKQRTNDTSLDAGKETVSQVCVNGTKEITWDVTKTDGKETNRVKKSEKVINEAVAEVTKVGTKQPAVTNSSSSGGASCSGGYVNSQGNCVQSPTASSSGPPAGATAQCVDGTYSFSQSRRGTCSHHGGVSRWL